jgi:hypothetical protein
VNVTKIEEGSAEITVSGLPDGATGYVIINVNGTEYAVNIAQNSTVTIPITKSGTYDVVATYLGDDKYASSSASTQFNASKITGEVVVDVPSTVAGGDIPVKVTVPDDATGNVTVKVGDKTVTVPVHGGENTIVVSGVGNGNYDVITTYSGDGKYDSKTVINTVTVTSSINANDKLRRGWNSPYDFEAEFLDKEGHVLVNTDVKFIVNGQTYTVKTDNKGIARLTTSHLAVGTYTVTCVNPVTGQQANKEVTIVERLIEHYGFTMDYRDGSSYSVRVIGDDGNPVGAGEIIAIKVNKVYYPLRTDANGYAVLPIKLIPGKYTITAEYKGAFVSDKIKVKQTLKLVKKTVKVKKGKKIILKAKLKWSNGKAIKGKKIVFKFRGKKYKAKTNKKGIAKVKIKKKKVLKKLRKGKKYKFSATYIDNTVKGKVKIKK